MFPTDLISYTLFEFQKKSKLEDKIDTLEETFGKKIEQLKKGICKQKQTVEVNYILLVPNKKKVACGDTIL